MFSSEELDSMLKDMLHAFRHYEFNGDDLTREERVEDEKRHELAWNTLNAMFQDHLKGQSHSLTAHSEDAVLETLRHWVRETNIGNLGGRKVLASLTECSDHLVRLTSDPNSAQEFAVWPYIKHLRYSSLLPNDW